MNMVNEPSPKNEPKETSTAFDKLLESPDVQKSIARIPDLIVENIKTKNALATAQIEAQVTIARGITKWTSILTVILAIVVVAAICWLSFNNKVSSDAVGVVLGAIIGSSFSFITRVFKRD
jgi:hypothetical protein